MTIADRPTHRLDRQTQPTMARCDVAWTISASTLEGGRSYGSAALQLECSWMPKSSTAPASCRAVLIRAGRSTEVPLSAGTRVLTEQRGRWTHLHIGVVGEPPILLASFESGRLIYCTSCVPAAAKLPGGSYDSPTGILELYEPIRNGSHE